MKTDKNGNLKLTSKDHRVGNFVYTLYADHVGFSDINSTVQTKVSKRTFIGQMLEMAVNEGNDRFLHNYGTMLYYLVGSAPDQAFIEEAYDALKRCMERHPELYGGKEVSDERDAEIIREQRELAEFVETVRNSPDE